VSEDPRLVEAKRCLAQSILLQETGQAVGSHSQLVAAIRQVIHVVEGPPEESTAAAVVRAGADDPIRGPVPTDLSGGQMPVSETAPAFMQEPMKHPLTAEEISVSGDIAPDQQGASLRSMLLMEAIEDELLDINALTGGLEPGERNTLRQLIDKHFTDALAVHIQRLADAVIYKGGDIRVRCENCEGTLCEGKRCGHALSCPVHVLLCEEIS